MSISYSTVVHESMIKLSGVNIGSSDQDIDMGMKKRNRDYDNFNNFSTGSKLEIY